MAEISLTPEYTDIDAALAFAVKTVSGVADKRKWSAAQKESALADVQSVYDSVTSLSGYADAYSETSYGWAVAAMPLLALAIDPGPAMCADFWKELATVAREKWKGLSGYSDLDSWLVAANTASGTTLESLDTASTGTIVSDAVVATAEDYGEIAETGGNILSNKWTWYGLAAAAALGGLVYIRGVFR